MKKTVLIIILFVASLSALKAQMSIFQVSWDIAFPMGEIKDQYIDEASMRGISIGGRKFVYDWFSFGGKAGWQTFNQKLSGTQIVNETTDLTGTQFRYVNAFPIMANAHFYMGQDEGIRPYIGTNVGVTFVTQRTDVGLWTVSDNSTHFGIAPEIGVLIPIGIAGGGISLSAKYEQAFKSNNAFDMHIQYLTASIGFIFAN
ncbi:MAG: hypothetical protein JXR07_13740 [Reichenbachiella sp.]